MFGSIILIVATTNAFNLLDGIDGLSASTALIAIIAMFLLSSMNDAFSVNFSPWIALAAIFGFLGRLLANLHKRVEGVVFFQPISLWTGLPQSLGLATLPSR